MKNILCLFLLAGTLAAQAQMPGNDLLRHIPADANKVIDINLGAISSKIDPSAIINLLGSQAKHKPFAMMSQILTSGIDIHQHVIIAQRGFKDADSPKYLLVIAHLTDSAKFVAFLRAKAKEAGGQPIHYLHLPGKQRIAVHDHDATGWTDKLAVLYVEMPYHGSADAQHPLAASQLKAARHTAAALQGFADTKFITNGHFATAFADDGDIHIWSHGNSLASLASQLGKLSPGMAQLGMLSAMSGQNKGENESIATIRFDNGSISYSTLKFLTPAAIASTERTLGQGLNPELLAIVPPHPLIGVATAHVDMAAMEDSIKKMPSFTMIDTMMQRKGINFWDIIHALRGDFMFLVCRPDAPATTDSSGKTKMPSPSIYLVASITDKAAFEKIVPMIKLKDALTADADTATTDTAHSKNPFPYYLVQNDLVVFGKRRRVNEFFTPGHSGDPVGKLLPEEYTRTNAINAIVDFHAVEDDLIGPTANAADASSKNKTAMDVLRNLETLQISAGAIHGDAMETRVQLNFVDKSKNSLSVLMNMIGNLSGKSGNP